MRHRQIPGLHRQTIKRYPCFVILSYKKNGFFECFVGRLDDALSDKYTSPVRGLPWTGHMI